MQLIVSLIPQLIPPLQAISFIFTGNFHKVLLLAGFSLQGICLSIYPFIFIYLFIHLLLFIIIFDFEFHLFSFPISYAITYSFFISPFHNQLRCQFIISIQQ